MTLILKLGKASKEVTSYRSINLLPLMTEVLESLIKRLLELIIENRIILTFTKYKLT